MEKLSLKLVFLTALLIFSLGLHATTEAARLGAPCRRDIECGLPCTCQITSSGQGKCVCGDSQAKLFEETLSKHPKVQKEVP
ncbi:hypothetical protein SLEP1_g46918 [Rubroshorea leprosula]|uniref:Uncharacterized protein n=1 Tax=Rubroshorea leprosula TaxID=152421 RepID=A0AAV5LPN6_9ROSI|nr:hypothetical protein SLEP1_g46918 [Rubroshorea leprosula]